MSRGHCRHHDWLSLDSFAADVALFLIGEPISGYYYRGIGSPEAAAAEQVTDALPVAFARRPLFARFARRAISSFLNDFKYHLEPLGHVRADGGRSRARNDGLDSTAQAVKATA